MPEGIFAPWSILPDCIIQAASTSTTYHLRVQGCLIRCVGCSSFAKAASEEDSLAIEGGRAKLFHKDRNAPEHSSLRTLSFSIANLRSNQSGPMTPSRVRCSYQKNADELKYCLHGCLLRGLSWKSWITSVLACNCFLSSYLSFRRLWISVQSSSINFFCRSLCACCLRQRFQYGHKAFEKSGGLTQLDFALF